MHVAVAIVGFRNPKDVRQCLEALKASTHENFEVVICENGGPAAFADLCETLPRALGGGQPVRVVLAPHNLGYGGGVNVCMANSEAADAWWILNPDTSPEPNAMAALVSRLAVGDCDLAGGIVYFPDGTVASYCGHWAPWLARPTSIGWGRDISEAVNVAAVERLATYFSGASMLASRRFRQTTGPFREDYFLYCEEVEWCLRGRSRGMRLGFTPEARVLHFQGSTTGSVVDHRKRPRMPVYLDNRNKILVTRDHFPMALLVASLAACAFLFLRCARRGAWRQLLFGIQGWMAGLGNERGVPSWWGGR
jgi:N-acetylglucosaminyl-diphospho-decaprenol L-rhamnosyltransferase